MPRKQVDLYSRMGRIQYAQLGDAEAAESNLLRGLAIDPAHVPTMEALTKQYSDRGDWLKAAQMMVRAESYTPVVLDKVRLLFEAAQHLPWTASTRTTQAKQLYAAVIALDPEHVEAGRPLADLYFERQQWAELSPVIDMLARKVGAAARRYRASSTSSTTAPRVPPTSSATTSKALALLQGGLRHRLDLPADPGRPGRPAVQDAGLGRAGKIYQTILVQHRDGQDEADVVRIYNRLGMVRQALGERKKALNMFEKALEIDPTHRDTLEAVDRAPGSSRATGRPSSTPSAA